MLLSQRDKATISFDRYKARRDILINVQNQFYSKINFQSTELNIYIYIFVSLNFRYLNFIKLTASIILPEFYIATHIVHGLKEWLYEFSYVPLSKQQ